MKQKKYLFWFLVQLFSIRKRVALQFVPLIFLSVLLSIPLIQPAHAAHWDFWFSLCGPEIVAIPEIVDRAPIPVGCEVDGPGCPESGPLDWKAQIDGKAFQGASLRFEGLDRKQLRALKLGGSARMEKDQIILGPGASTITGLPTSINSRVPVGFLKPLVNEEFLEGPLGTTDISPTVRDEGSGQIRILQYSGSYAVNRFGVRINFRNCPPLHRSEPGLVFDMIKLTNNTFAPRTPIHFPPPRTPNSRCPILNGPDKAIILADLCGVGNNNSVLWENDWDGTTDTSISVGNAIPASECGQNFSSRVAVFSDDNAMSYEKDVSEWNRNGGNVHTVNLQPLIEVPVNVWVTTTNSVNNINIIDRVNNDFSVANLLYDCNNVGVKFNPIIITDLRQNQNAITQIGGQCPTDRTVLGSWYTTTSLNFYYVDYAGNAASNTCRFPLTDPNPRNVIYINPTYNDDASVAHEIGHAFGLRPAIGPNQYSPPPPADGHTNGLPGFSANNIMQSAATATRDHFSVGQAFRMNVHKESMLNQNGPRLCTNPIGCTEVCKPEDTSDLCPELGKDSLLH